MNTIIARSLQFPGTANAGQTKDEFQRELSKIKSKELKRKVLFLFNNPLVLKGACFACGYKGIFIRRPRLSVVSNRKNKTKTVLIKGVCFHPDLPKCNKKTSKIIGVEKN